MPFLELPTAEFIVDIPPAVVQGVTINRKVHSHTIQIEEMDGRVVMHVMVTYYGNDGKKLNAPGIEPYMRMLIADNNYFADITTGLPLCLVSEEYDSEGNLNPLLEGKTYAKQFDLFRYMMSQPTTIDDMKRSNILNALALGRLD